MIKNIFHINDENDAKSSKQGAGVIKEDDSDESEEHSSHTRKRHFKVPTWAKIKSQYFIIINNI